jgi:hypothetical protein
VVLRLFSRGGGFAPNKAVWADGRRASEPDIGRGRLDHPQRKILDFGAAPMDNRTDDVSPRKF